MLPTSPASGYCGDVCSCLWRRRRTDSRTPDRRNGSTSPHFGSGANRHNGGISTNGHTRRGSLPAYSHR